VNLFRRSSSISIRFRQVLGFDLIKRKSGIAFVFALFNRNPIRRFFENVFDWDRRESLRQKLSHRKAVVLRVEPNQFSKTTFQTDRRNRISFHKLTNIKRRKK
jgi:hypothetical protein